MDATQEKICPKCKTVNPIAANFCRHCRHEFSEASKNGTELSPQIKVFRVKESSYTIGSTIHLEWDVANAAHVRLFDKEQDEKSSLTKKVDGSFIVTLIAENDYDSVSRQIKITPSPLPSISYFKASSECILQGHEVEIEWSVSEASQVVLKSSTGETSSLSLHDTVRVKPISTTTYRLRCISVGDPKVYVDQTIAVRVLNPVYIDKFTADTESLIESKKTTLRWQVRNASHLEILPLHSDVTRLRSIQISPTQTTEYRLVARNELSTAESTITIVVQPLPKLALQSMGKISDLELPSCRIEKPSFKPEWNIHIPSGAKYDVVGRMRKANASVKQLWKRLTSYPRKIRKFIK